MTTLPLEFLQLDQPIFCLSHEYQSFCSSLLFESQSPPNLLAFLLRSIGRKNLKVARQSTLEFITSYIKQVGKEHIDPHAHSIFATCITIYREDSGEHTIQTHALLLIPFKQRYTLLSTKLMQ